MRTSVEAAKRSWFSIANVTPRALHHRQEICHGCHNIARIRMVRGRIYHHSQQFRLKEPAQLHHALDIRRSDASGAEFDGNPGLLYSSGSLLRTPA